MSYSLVFYGAPDGGDGPFHLSSGVGWKLFGDWLDSLPGCPLLHHLSQHGEVKNTQQLGQELNQAVAKYPSENPNVADTAKVLAKYVGIGDPEEWVTIADDPDDFAVENTFCPTGEGGGIDPTCSPQGQRSEAELLKATRDAYDRLYGGAGPKMKAKEAKVLEAQYRKDLKELEDVRASKGRHPAPSASVPLSSQPSSQGAVTVDHIMDAFRRVDAANTARSSYRSNFVHLGDMRALLPQASREDFDQALHQARMSGQILLTPAEGRHGMTQRDQDSAVHDKDPVRPYVKTAMLYASVRR